MILPNHKSSYMILISSMSFFVLLEALKILCRIIHVSNAWIRWKLFHPKRKQLSKLNEFWKKRREETLKIFKSRFRSLKNSCQKMLDRYPTFESKNRKWKFIFFNDPRKEVKSFYNLVFEMSSSFITYEGLKCGWH